MNDSMTSDCALGNRRKIILRVLFHEVANLEKCELQVMGRGRLAKTNPYCMIFRVRTKIKRRTRRNLDVVRKRC